MGTEPMLRRACRVSAHVDGAVDETPPAFPVIQLMRMSAIGMEAVAASSFQRAPDHEAFALPHDEAG